MLPSTRHSAPILTPAELAADGPPVSLCTSEGHGVNCGKHSSVVVSEYLNECTLENFHRLAYGSRHRYEEANFGLL